MYNVTLEFAEIYLICITGQKKNVVISFSEKSKFVRFGPISSAYAKNLTKRLEIVVIMNIRSNYVDSFPILVLSKNVIKMVIG